MSSNWVHAITPNLLASQFDSATIARGQAYARAGMVLDFDWDDKDEDDDEVLMGTCAGSRNQTYRTEVYFSAVGPQWEISDTYCSCPIGFECKHAVALLLTAATSAAAGISTGHSQPPSWESLLAPILAESMPKSTGKSLALLVIAVQETSRYRNGLVVGFRPMTLGKNGRWVRKGISWRTLQSPDRAGIFDAGHYRALQAVLAAEARSAHYSYVAPEQIDLFTSSAAIWESLRTAVAAGIPFITDRSPLIDRVEFGHNGQLGLVIGPGTEPGAAAIDAELVVDEQLWDLGSTLLVGTPVPHGVYRIEDRVLTMAPFQPMPSKALIDLVRSGQQAQIPATDAVRFSTEVLPVLESSIPLQVAEGLFAPPEISGPTPLLTVKVAGESARAYWSIRYVVNGQHHDFDPLRRVAGVGFRDESAEDVAWQQIVDVLRRVAGTSNSWPDQARQTVKSRMSVSMDSALIAESERVGTAQTIDDALTAASITTLCAGVNLYGVEAARLHVEVLPELADRDDIVVELSSEPADYRRSEAVPQLEFSAPEAQTGGNDWFDLEITVTVEDEKIPIADLIRQLTAGATHMLLASGTYFALDAPELTRLIELLEEGRALGEIESGQAKAGSYNVTLWEELLELGVVDEQTRAWQETLARLRTARPPHDVKPPQMLQAELRPYQHDGLNWLSFLWDSGLGGVLADDMGLGKTLQTLALIGRIREGVLDVAGPFLVVAPTSVIANWAAECERFTPDLTAVTVTATAAKSRGSLRDRVAGADIVITSYTLFRIDFDAFDGIEWAGLILDEAQFVKNYNAKAHQCARRLDTPFKLAITGTPMENNLMELWSLLSITAPGLFARPQHFTDYFRKPIESGSHPERLATLRRRIRPMMLRRTKDQVATDLPPKQEQVVPVALATKHQKVYDTRLARERQKVLGLLGDWEKNRFEIFRSLTMLRQLSLHAGLVDQSKLNLPSAKIEFLVEQLPALIAEGHSALLFSQFTGFLSIIREHLDAAEVPYSYLDGSLTSRRRTAEIKKFSEGSVKVFLISLKAGGFGLNLTEADYCFVCDPWWNPAAEAQAVDRTHRIGQTRPVTVYRLVSAGTIEEKVVALQNRKRELFTAVMDEGEMFGSAIGVDDIRELLGVTVG